MSSATDGEPGQGQARPLSRRLGLSPSHPVLDPGGSIPGLAELGQTGKALALTQMEDTDRTS